jgi:hypothetical protein
MIIEWEFYDGEARLFEWVGTHAWDADPPLLVDGPGVVTEPSLNAGTRGTEDPKVPTNLSQKYDQNPESTFTETRV